MTLHIANTQFEWELLQTKTISLKTSFYRHPLHRQLQFLPFLYAHPDDAVLLFCKPSDDYWLALKRIRKAYPRPIYYDQLQLDGCSAIESWGFSQSIANFAKKHRLQYPHPSFEITKQVTSKLFSFSNTPKLPNSLALHEKKDLDGWFELDVWPKVIKVCFETAGRGFKIIQCKTALHYNEALQFCEKEWIQGRPLIGEPWVERTSDFSSQWHIGNEINFTGFTSMECSELGTYQKTSTGTKTFAFLDAHFEIAKQILEKMKKLGYFGMVGFDGFTYDCQLHPINEINPRKTMGWVALKLANILNNKLSIQFVSARKAKQPLLPFQVRGSQPFKLQLDLRLSSMIN